MDFIIDRTSEDVIYAQSFMTAIWSKMSNEQKEEWLKGTTRPLESLKGFFNYTDMNRIKNNYNSLRTTYSYTDQDVISNTYEMTTIPNLTSMSADFEKIKAFGSSCLPVFYLASFTDYRTIEDLSSSVNRIDFNFLNDYEHILKNLFDYNNDGELNIECDYNYNTNDIELDGVLFGLTQSGHSVKTKIPSGYICTYELGKFQSSGYVVSTTESYITDGEEKTINLTNNNYGYHFKVESGITDNDTVMNFGTSGNTVDTTYYDKLNLSSDMLQYETTVNYTASAVQSDLINVADKTSSYFYNVSDYSGNIIITTYDESEDVIDEFALTENIKIDLTGVSYFTIDSEVGDTLTYLLSSGTTFSTLYLSINGQTFQYPESASFDVSEVSTIQIMQPAPYDYKFVVNIRKSVEGGKDISQLDTSEIEVKYI